MLILSAAECRALLTKTAIGRVVFTNRALPAIQPVNFFMDGDRLVIRTAAGSTLATAARDTTVAFEIDDFDVATRTGWSVVVVGRARVVTAPDARARLDALPLRSWVPGRHDHAIRPKRRERVRDLDLRPCATRRNTPAHGR